MCRALLLVVVIVLVLLMVVAAVVVQQHGWVGFLVYIGALVVLAWALKSVIPRVLGHLIMRPMRAMGRALRGATLVVHSVTPSEAPQEVALTEPDPDDEDTEDGPPNPALQWYVVEFTIKPPGSIEAIPANREAWMPSMLSVSAVGDDAEGDESDFEPATLADDDPDDEPPEQLFGEQRLRMLVGVAPRVDRVQLVYAGFTPVGEISFPRINLRPGTDR